VAPVTVDTPVVAPPPDDLASLVPEEARVVVVASPRAILADPVLERVAQPLWTREWEDAFELRTGIAPREIESFVYASFPEDGFVALLRAPRDMPDVTVAAGMRMNAIRVSRDEPLVRRTGYLGTELRDVVAIGEHELLVAGGEAGAHVLAILEAVETGSSSRGALREMPRAEAPVQVYAPHPLDLPADSPAGLLLAQQRTMHAGLTSRGEELEMRLTFTGEFPARSEENFRRLVASLAASPLGRTLGIEAGLPTLSVRAEDEVVLELRVAADDVRTGVHVLFRDDWHAVLDHVGEPANSADGSSPH